ncbi:MAG: tripartite tricarboxylate transporter substrate binding protein [Desulfobacteraceae bacterium]|jgi:tripartite-type tricarboxylate transporter receptor subunit TctC|nr:MAG: tripartite tricarboxylate transporter substrate binding protein [Desulfobacteraceae bacterium]
MKKAGILVLIVAMVFSAAVVSAEWKPARPISLIVPWAAGGATDQTCRTLAGEMEKVLGQKIPVLNQPGGSGSIGMKNAYEAKHDGYTWAGNADGSVITYQVLDLLPTISHRDWIHYYGMLTAPVICVREDSKIKTIQDLVAEFKARPGEVRVASAGAGAGGHLAAETFRKAAGIEYRHIPYKGGYPAVVATVGGETEVVMQLSMEVADMLRAKKLRALANMSTQSLVIDGYGEVPPVMQFIPKHAPLQYLFGLYLPKGVPPEVVEAVNKAFDVAAASDSIKRLAKEKASAAVNYKGEEALKLSETTGNNVNCILKEIGMAKKDPVELGFKCE